MALITKEKNSNILKETNIEVFCEDALSFLNAPKDKYDVVFVDPPYKLEIYEKTLELLEKNELLQPFSIVVFESDKDLNISENEHRKLKAYKYGLAKIYVIRYKR